MPKISLIIPVYNVETHVEACLKSILTQSFTDFEIICINDGSTDRSLDILQRLAASDSRIRILTQPNKGPSPARNTGLKLAQGDIVMFPDADDYLLPGALATVIKMFNTKNPEILTFGAKVFPKNYANPWLLWVLNPRNRDYQDFHPNLCTSESASPFVWRSAFSHAFLQRENLTFNETVKLGEDQLFYFKAYPRSRKTTLISETLYAYRINRSGSLMDIHSANLTKRASEHLQIVKNIYDDWHHIGILRQYADHLVAWSISFLREDLEATNGELQEQIRSGLLHSIDKYFSPQEIKKLRLDTQIRLTALRYNRKINMLNRILIIAYSAATRPAHTGRAALRRIKKLLRRKNINSHFS